MINGIVVLLCIFESIFFNIQTSLKCRCMFESTSTIGQNEINGLEKRTLNRQKINLTLIPSQSSDQVRLLAHLSHWLIDELINVLMFWVLIDPVPVIAYLLLLFV